LTDADLRGADLRGAYLTDADLRGADLTDAYLRGAKGIDKYLTTSLYMLYDQPDKIRAYKLVNEDMEGIYNGGLKYEIGKTIKVKEYNEDEHEHCGAGINLATLDWCLRYRNDGNKIIICEFTAKDIVAIPIGSDGKFRVKKCKAIGYKEIEVKEGEG
jgi:uncharacterized protein YjbI with pentapeptide repeats